MKPIYGIILMALTTYIIRVSPFVLFRKKIESPFIQSFLFYIPYAILTAMTIPDIFYSTHFVPAAVAGTLVALLLGWFEKSLITVSMSAVAIAYIVITLFN
ncbi:AzlD domain-containing protein [Vallitaleaceae bacterium 9-2]